eukprot:scaffold129777_cov72-Phaeocystis_antarctica.AAC.1
MRRRATRAAQAPSGRAASSRHSLATARPGGQNVVRKATLGRRRRAAFGLQAADASLGRKRVAWAGGSASGAAGGRVGWLRGEAL